MNNASGLGLTTDAVRVDRTSSVKEHFEVLDGLRGSAAFLIVIFHLFNYSFGFDNPLSLVRHAYLAVDFFFGLSGFVVAYAYDDLSRMNECCIGAPIESCNRPGNEARLKRKELVD